MIKKQNMRKEQLVSEGDNIPFRDYSALDYNRRAIYDKMIRQTSTCTQ
jgi:hypothetical protein